MRHYLRAQSAASAIIFICVMVPLYAQDRDAGTTIFDFVNINYDAQKVALAGAAVALPNDCYGIFSNPAALGYINNMQAVIGYRPLGVGIFGAPLAYALPERRKRRFRRRLLRFNERQYNRYRYRT